MRGSFGAPAPPLRALPTCCSLLAPPPLGLQSLIKVCFGTGLRSHTMVKLHYLSQKQFGWNYFGMQDNCWFPYFYRCQLFVYSLSMNNSAVYLHFQLFVYILSMRNSAVYLHFSCLFTVCQRNKSAVHVHFQLFVYIFKLKLQLYNYISAVCLHFQLKNQLFIYTFIYIAKLILQLFIYIFSCLLTKYVLGILDKF